jgi:hypothetical protein
VKVLDVASARSARIRRARTTCAIKIAERLIEFPFGVLLDDFFGHTAGNAVVYSLDDVSRQIADEIQERCDLAGEPVPEGIWDFVEDHTSPALQFGS